MPGNETAYAGFWVRLGATLIDWVLMVVVSAPLLASVYGWDYWSQDNTLTPQGPAYIIINWVLPAIAVVAFWAKKQATPGKMAFSCKIVDAETGDPATLTQLVIRYASYFVAMLPFFAGVLWIVFDRRKQGWHDKLARTVVLKVSRKDDDVRFGPKD